MENREEILQCMIDRLAGLLAIDAASMNADTKFADLGMKSVTYSQLTGTLENECDVEVPFMDFRRKATLGEAADYVVSLIEG